jgi:DNA-binding CsgD family transcriptional regulator
MVLSGASAVLAVVALLGVFTDDRVLTGAPIWLKVFKFAVSFTVYGVTLAWMLSLLPVRSRRAERAATVVVVMSVLELVVIVAQVVRGRASHFNESTLLDMVLWRVMGTSILVLWLAHLIIAVVVARRPLGDRAATYGVRAGLIVSLLGMLAAVPMVLPTAAPGTPGVTGAHAVGVPDGGAGMPLTGWSITGGDLRIGHFVGLHALQALPLLALLLTVAARRGGRLASRLDEPGRARLVVVAAVGYAAVTVLLTWQALRGQPLLRPDALTLAALAAVVTGCVVASARVLTARPAPPAEVAEAAPVGWRGEHDVLELVATGLSNTEIAERLHIGVTTVKTHITNLMTKTGSPNRVRMALVWSRATPPR